jgi:hypothetical protein
LAHPVRGKNLIRTKSKRPSPQRRSCSTPASESQITFSKRQLARALEALVHRGPLATRFQLKCLLNREAFEIILDLKKLPFCERRPRVFLFESGDDDQVRSIIRAAVEIESALLTDRLALKGSLNGVDGLSRAQRC